eukprot:CAMPEP_0119519226 /NCGR_PEP_ID=MMETSP1344-20130328/35602_1 /TAXON_ID=236787 /ORGANISM="Florenciella parvula, Strain CCMP2471" /LENGTH=50 /DNA_ID=CAMNT_0007556977 /DNA_START=84 /DNA_END=232 /DNA_ORIENTATION=+
MTYTISPFFTDISFSSSALNASDTVAIASGLTSPVSANVSESARRFSNES